MKKKSFKLNLTLWIISVVAIHLITYLLICFVRLDFNLWEWIVSLPMSGRGAFLFFYIFVIFAVLALEHGFDCYYFYNKNLK